MTILKKKTKVSDQWHTRARAVIAAHPRISWGTLAAIFGILGVVVPWVLSWEARYQRVEAAKLEAKQIRSEIADHAKEDATEKKDRMRSDAWQRVGNSRIEVLILRNRVNECNVERAKRNGMTALEVNVCQQYDDELKQGQALVERLQNAAMALSQ